VGYCNTYTDIIYQEIFYVQYNQKLVIEPKRRLLIFTSLLRFSIALPMNESLLI